jgi:hypothetical protein
MVAAVLWLASGSAAVAASPLKNELDFQGVSAHGHFAIEILTECTRTDPRCANRSDRKTTFVGVGLNVGPQSSKCGASGQYDDFGIALKGDSFRQTAGSDGDTFTVSGTFEGSKQVVGKIVAPPSCGGTDTFVATYKGQWPDVTNTGYPPDGV